MQTHLKGFGLENFRVFKDYTWFDFAPITILTGPNSSGKSSLNKALLLLKDNFEKGNLPPYYSLIWEGHASADENLLVKRDGEFDVEGEYRAEYKPSTLRFDSKSHNLGNLEASKCRGSDSNTISFSIPYKIKVGPSLDLNEARAMIEGSSKSNFDIIGNIIGNDFLESEKVKNDLFKKIVTDENLNEKIYKAFENRGSDSRIIIYHLVYRVHNNILNIEYIEFKNERNIVFLRVDDKSIFFNVEIYNDLFIFEKDKISILLDQYEKYVYAAYQIDLAYWFTKNGLSEEISNNIYSYILGKIGISINDKNSLKYTVKTIETCLFDFEIISTNRYNQKRVYDEDDSSDFKNTLKSLEQIRDNDFPLNDFFLKWSKLFNLPRSINFKYDSEQATYFPHIENYSLVNYGYGFSLLANLIFKIVEVGSRKYSKSETEGAFYISEQTSLLVLEEPETNLHPKFQSLLADFLVEAANTFKIQFIIETHSEYLIRKLQFLTAKKTIKPSDSVIYYFHHPDNVPVGEKQVKKIEILDDGSLSDEFGPGFFDEAANWELELLRLKNSKIRNN